MYATMKPTLMRLKAVFAANFTSYVVSFLLTTLLIAAVYVLGQVLGFQAHRFVFTRKWASIFLVASFLIPIYAYISFNISNVASGLKEIRLDTKAMKRSLFISGGVLWSSLGWLLVGKLLGAAEYAIFLAAVISIVAWYVMNKLLMRYVFTL